MKSAITILFLFIRFHSFGNVNNEILTENPPVADSIVDYATSFLGVPYVWAGTTPTGFDCSGFVYYVFKKFGYKIERSSSGLDRAGKNIDLQYADRGDLILFTGTDPNDKSVGHVGIVISCMNDPLVFVHASSSKAHFGVVITEYLKSGYPKRYVGIRRLLNRS